MKNTNETDESICAIEPNEDANSVACQVRRKIEDYLERKRYQDELGEFDKEELA